MTKALLTLPERMIFTRSVYSGTRFASIERGQGDFARRHPHQIAERELGAARLHGGPEADLRQPALQRHLAALEPGLVIAAFARALALDAAAASLALTGGCAAPDAQVLPLGAGRRLDGV